MKPVMVLIVLIVAATLVTADHDGAVHCSTNAECDVEKLWSCIGGHCECPNGYTESKDGYCLKTFMEVCDTDSECNTSRILKCDTAIRRCVCQIPGEQMFEEARQSCVSRVGFNCDHEGGDLECVRGAFCDSSEVNGVHKHACTCNAGWTTEEDLTCSSANALFQVTLFFLLGAVFISKNIL